MAGEFRPPTGPYSDGNGRIGRLVIVLQLMRLGVLRHPILVVSPWFEARRVAYQDALLALSVSGDWNGWIAFFATGVEAAADTTRRRVDGLLAWQADALRRVRDARVPGLAERLATDLIGLPVLRAGQAAPRYGVTHQPLAAGPASAGTRWLRARRRRFSDHSTPTWDEFASQRSARLTSARAPT